MKKWLLFFFIPLFIACTKNPYIHRSQLLLIPPSQEVQMGLQAERQIFKKYKISHNVYYNRFVQEVGWRLAKVAQKEFHINYQWEFYVLDTPKINAFCLPGGKVFVYTGLLKLVESPDELATVLGHEIAHAILHHGAERLSMAMVGNLAKELIAKGMEASGKDVGPLFDLAYGITTQYGILYPYSRKFEYEADKVGLYLMYKACYNPDAAIRFWQKMMHLSKNELPEFLSTHPSDTHRLEALKRYIIELKKVPRECGE